MDDGSAAFMALFWIGVMWVIPMFVASKVWANKGGSAGAGFLMGLLLGWIGVAIAAVVAPSGANLASIPGSPPRAFRECPHCKEGMRRDASVCPHCQRESEAWRFHEGFWWVNRGEGNYWLNEKTGKWVRHESSPILGATED